MASLLSNKQLLILPVLNFFSLFYVEFGSQMSLFFDRSWDSGYLVLGYIHQKFLDKFFSLLNSILSN